MKCEAVELEEKLCKEMEPVRELTYPGDRLRAAGGCVLAVTA